MTAVFIVYNYYALLGGGRVLSLNSVEAEDCHMYSTCSKHTT